MISFMVMDRNHPERQKAESLIRDVYAREYEAVVPVFSDQLVALMGLDGAILAAAGIRIGDKFFSEVYLDQPIEQTISEFWSAPVKRTDVAEVTTMASLHPKASFRLMVEIVRHLRGAGVSWAFFTVTERLRALLKRMDIVALDLAAADPAKLADGGESWGSYYGRNPRVVAIHDSMAGVFAADAVPQAAPQESQEIA